MKLKAMQMAWSKCMSTMSAPKHHPRAELWKHMIDHLNTAPKNNILKKYIFQLVLFQRFVPCPILHKYGSTVDHVP